jgi:hypothetical protein
MYEEQELLLTTATVIAFQTPVLPLAQVTADSVIINN